MTWRDDSGFSLTELLVVCVLLVFVLGLAWSTMDATNTLSGRLSAGAVATGESEAFLDHLTLELRQANSLTSIAETGSATPQGAFSEIAPRETTFYVDLYHNGVPEKVQYAMNGNSLIRNEWTATGGYPYNWPSTPNKTSVVIQKVDPSWNGPIFTYYTNDLWPPTQITNVSQVASVTAVLVQIRNQQPWGNVSQSYGASTTVRVRSIDNGF